MTRPAGTTRHPLCGPAPPSDRGRDPAPPWARGAGHDNRLTPRALQRAPSPMRRLSGPLRDHSRVCPPERSSHHRQPTRQRARLRAISMPWPALAAPRHPPRRTPHSRTGTPQSTTARTDAQRHRGTPLQERPRPRPGTHPGKRRIRAQALACRLTGRTWGKAQPRKFPNNPESLYDPGPVASGWTPPAALPAAVLSGKPTPRSEPCAIHRPRLPCPSRLSCC